MTEAADADDDDVEGKDIEAEHEDANGRGGDHVSEVEDLVAQVATEDEELAAEVATMGDRIAELEAELDEREADVEDLESRLKRARADFQNYKKRAERRQAEIKERATEDLVERLLDIRDNLLRALEQDDDVEIRDGVEATLSTFDRILEDENVNPVEPEPGDDVDPERHEVVMRTDSDRPEGTIDQVYRPGYEMAGKVLRPAQVTVSDGPENDDAEG